MNSDSLASDPDAQFLVERILRGRQLPGQALTLGDDVFDQEYRAFLLKRGKAPERNVRQPFRQALKRLSEAGLLTSGQGAKRKVRELSQNEREANLMTRELIEIAAISHMTVSFSDETTLAAIARFNDLTSMLEGLAERGEETELSRFFSIDLECHLTIVRASGFSSVESAISRLFYEGLLTWSDQERAEEQSPITKETLVEIATDHRAIADALRSKDCKASVIALQRHIDNCAARGKREIVSSVKEKLTNVIRCLRIAKHARRTP